METFTIDISDVVNNATDRDCQTQAFCNYIGILNAELLSGMMKYQMKF